MNALQGQHHAVNQEISRLTAENQQLRQTGSPLLAEIETLVGQAVLTAISNANSRSNERHSLVDIRGLGKLLSKENLQSSLSGSRKTAGFLIAACGSAFWPLGGRGENVITNEAIDRQFGPFGAEPI